MPEGPVHRQYEIANISVPADRRLQMVCQMLGRRREDALEMIIDDAWNRLIRNEPEERKARLMKSVQIGYNLPKESLIPTFDSPEILEQTQKAAQEATKESDKQNLRPETRAGRFARLEAEARNTASKAAKKA